MTFNRIRGDSVENFSEYYGDAKRRCQDVPLSIVGFTPPAVNYKGSDIYEFNSTFRSSSDPASNPCHNGGESQGVLFTVLWHNFKFTDGVLIYLGGLKPHIPVPIERTPTTFRIVELFR